MRWRVVYSGRARRDLKRLDATGARRVLEALNRLATTQHGDVRRLRGRARRWRLRVGDWRVLFAYEPPENTLLVFNVHHRREAYRE